MNRTVSLIFLSIGTVLVIYCFNALGSLISAFSGFRSGAPTDRTVWLMIAGVVLFGVGVGGVVFGRKPTLRRS
ncbi:MAG TPA: DUF3185 family protein [Lacunisphaera sp.]|nr:DUF3185 family protein [Lacunisphaera sp.]